MNKIWFSLLKLTVQWGERRINQSVKQCDKSNIGGVWRGQEGIPGSPSELHFSEQMQGRVREGLRTHEQRPWPQTQGSVHWPCVCIIRTNISNPTFQPSHCQLPSESQSHRAEPGQRHLLVAGATTWCLSQMSCAGPYTWVCSLALSEEKRREALASHAPPVPG